MWKENQLQNLNKERPQKLKKEKIRIVIGILIIACGLSIFFYPDISESIMEKKNEELIEDYIDHEQNLPEETPVVDAVETEEDQAKKVENDSNEAAEASSKSYIAGTAELLKKIRQYNTEIYENKQAGFKDAWSVTKPAETIDELKKGMFGYIEIPVMNCSLPIYIGASTSHLDKGAAVLGATSIPIGGINTNSVIAGHRGWKSKKYFKQIEKLKVGNYIYVTNPWETLCYRVESIDIIQPSDSDKLKIQEGKDMVTLITCHPYRSHGKYRYVVYCVRDDMGENVNNENSNLAEKNVADADLVSNNNEYLTAMDGNIYTLSEDDIETETRLRRGGAVCIMIIAVITMMKFVSNRKEKKV